MTPETFIALWEDNKLTECGGAQAHFDEVETKNCPLFAVDRNKFTFA